MDENESTSKRENSLNEDEREIAKETPHNQQKQSHELKSA